MSITKNNSYYKVIPFQSVFRDTGIILKLKRGSAREKAGQAIDYMTPLYASKSGTKGAVIQPQTRISGVKGYVPVVRHKLVEHFFSSIILPTIKNPDYMEGEEKFYKYRFSGRSIRVPGDMIVDKAVVPYFKNAQTPVKDKRVVRALELGLNDGIAKLNSTIPISSLRPLSAKASSDELPATTNWGAPYFMVGKEMKGNEIVADNRDKYIKIAEQIIRNRGKLSDKQRLENSFGSIGRGQETNDVEDKWQGKVKPKQRRPGAEAHAGTIIGGMMKPFLDKRASNPTRAALVNQATVDEVVFDNWRKVATNEGVVSGDGSSFDTHMMPGLALRIGEAIVERFAASAEVKQTLLAYFHHIFYDPLITPDGIFDGEHGMPSGTTFTNELDSCYNEVLVEAFKYLPSEYTLGAKVVLSTVTDQGDDLIVNFKVENSHKALKDPETVKEILSKGYEAMNMSVNPKKQMVSRDKCEYLKRLHVKGIKPSYRSYTWSVIGMLNMEHGKDGKGPMYSARGIMQAANHYSELEGFNEFMKFIADGDIELHLGVGSKAGAHGVLQMAGGSEKVIKRLGYSAYTTHLGVDVKKGHAKLGALSSARGIDSHK